MAMAMAVVTEEALLNAVWVRRDLETGVLMMMVLATRSLAKEIGSSVDQAPETEALVVEATAVLE